MLSAFLGPDFMTKAKNIRRETDPCLKSAWLRFLLHSLNFSSVIPKTDTHTTNGRRNSVYVYQQDVDITSEYELPSGVMKKGKISLCFKGAGSVKFHSWPQVKD